MRRPVDPTQATRSVRSSRGDLVVTGGRTAEDGGPAAGPARGRWERYLEAERRVMEENRRGRLTGALGAPLWGGSPEELKLLAREERRAEEGLVELLENGELGMSEPEGAPEWT